MSPIAHRFAEMQKKEASTVDEKVSRGEREEEEVETLEHGQEERER